MSLSTESTGGGEEVQSNSGLDSMGAAQASPVAGVEPSDPLQEGLQLAMQAVWLFLDSDFEQVERVMGRKRHSLLYASEGYAAINYMRATMTFTREAMQSAQDAAQSTINLAAHYRKARGVAGLISGQSSRAGSPLSSREQTPASRASESNGQTKPHGLFRIDSPRLTLRSKKAKQRGHVGSGLLQQANSSTTSVDSLASGDSHQALDAALLDAPFSELQDEPEVDAELDRKQPRSWTTGVVSVADSLIGIVRAGTQAAGLSRPEWQALRAMTALQRHAELVHAEAHLMRAMLNVAMGDGVMALLREGWHVRAAYATYRNCYAFVQDAYAAGEVVDDHFVSGTYFGMGVFNIVLSMLPARLLRFIELVGFSADRALGIELLYIASGWRAQEPTQSMLGAAPCKGLHPCGYGLRSEFCALALHIYHVVLCTDLFLGFPNLPLVDAVLHKSLREHSGGLLYMYFEGRLLMARAQLDDAIARYSQLVQEAKSDDDSAETNPNGESAEAKLLADLAKLSVDGSPDASEESDSPSDDTPKSSSSQWRQLQYLGYWERSLCLMALGRWLEAAQGFDTLRRENNWNKAVYTYALACCVWEHYLGACDGWPPEDRSDGLDARQTQLLETVCTLMRTVPSLKRKMAGKSIPIEKFVIRKARKFHDQRCFLMRPGLELLHVWNLYSKTPQSRLVQLATDVDADIARLAQFQPAQRAMQDPYRHANYYDDLALLLLTKGYIARERAYPSHTMAHNSPSVEIQQPSSDETAVAANSLVRVLRLLPFIELDHHLAALARFHLGILYLDLRSTGDARRWTDRALAQWKAILDGRPMVAPPILSIDEYKAYAEIALPTTGGNGPPACATEEAILAATGHPSLKFYDNASWLAADWKFYPPRWSASRKYSLENMIEVRTFNATNRLNDSTP
ncbi:hypothetical protein EV175_004955 [Coemansia sp. RSA 1933]|nr:hypothetical protein EV175_004955 [Coemansia sp. RSA 1933]